ncbi:glutamine dumper 5 [Euphorbia peplus]|nr:glutamine dumper 5 [Euphorbia peplus]
MGPESSASGVALKHWNSPVPYLFGGLAAMLGLIGMALLILACSSKKPHTNLQPQEDNNNDRKMEMIMMMPMEMEPKIVVIMPGDHNPTFFAKPSLC